MEKEGPTGLEGPGKNPKVDILELRPEWDGELCRKTDSEGKEVISLCEGVMTPGGTAKTFHEIQVFGRIRLSSH